MFREGLKRFGLGALILSGLVLAACDGRTDNPAVDAGNTPGEDASGPAKDAEPKDGSPDSPLEDAGPDAPTPMPCTGDGAPGILGNYVAKDGSQHWLRKTVSATTYARVPVKGVNNVTPSLWKITQVCSNEKAFLAVTEAKKVARVDWAQDVAGLQLCVAVDDATDVTAALTAGKSTAGSATGCKGGSWTTLTAKDGGL